MSEARPGQPTKYKPEYCDQLIEHMTQGLSYESFGAVIKVDRSTLYNWEREHLEFKAAKEIGFQMSLLFWEKLGINNILNSSESFGEGRSESKSLNGSVWIFNMKNRFGWRDRQKDEVDTVVNNTNTNALGLSADEIREKITAKLAKLNGSNES